MKNDILKNSMINPQQGMVKGGGGRGESHKIVK